MYSTIKNHLETTELNFNLIVCGSRSRTERYGLLVILLPLLRDPTLKALNIRKRLVIIDGGAKGADRVGRDVAILLGLAYETYEADWTTSPRGAGYIRNAQMVNISHATVALWDGVSKGSAHTIKISKKKGIPTMIDEDKVPTGLTDDECVTYFVKHHLLNNLTFEVGTTGEEYLTEVENYTGNDIVDHIGVLDNTLTIKPEYINGVSLEYLWNTLITHDYDGSLARRINACVLEIKDIITPKKVNLVYMKIDTGGFSGYQRTLRAKGEELYPILRITVKVNDYEALDLIINPGDKLGNINPKTKEIHERSGLLELSKQSADDIPLARRKIEHYFQTCNVVSTNPTNNTHTHLVGFNTAFIRAFISAQIPGLFGSFSPRDVDVNQLSSLLELTGNYDSLPVPQVYRADPKSYLDSLAFTVKRIISPTDQ